MAEATQNYVLVNGGIEVDVIKVSKDTTLTFQEAIQQKNQRFPENPLNPISTILFNTFDINMYANYYSSKELNAISDISIYKQTPGKNYYDFICQLPAGRVSLYDYNVANDNYYHYIAVVQIQSSNGMTYEVYEKKDIETNHPLFYKAYWKNWSITNIKKSDILENAYEQFGYVWNLSYNITDENLTQNTSVTSWDTLGKYPKISIGSKNYDSSTFSGMLGEVIDYQKITLTSGSAQESDEEENDYQVKDIFGYTERFNYKLSKPFDDIDLTNVRDYQEFIKIRYANEMEKYKAWREFINDGNLKLLKDLKGNTWIVQVLENPTYDIDNKPSMAPTRISFQWQEVEDINNTAIINFDINP